MQSIIDSLAETVNEVIDHEMEKFKLLGSQAKQMQQEDEEIRDIQIIHKKMAQVVRGLDEFNLILRYKYPHYDELFDVLLNLPVDNVSPGDSNGETGL